MSKALALIEKIERLKENMPYLGQRNDYSTQPYDVDAQEYMNPFMDLQKPDYSGLPDKLQTKLMMRKSRGEDGVENPIN